jgi:hypothetical protein
MALAGVGKVSYYDGEKKFLNSAGDDDAGETKKKMEKIQGSSKIKAESLARLDEVQSVDLK